MQHRPLVKLLTREGIQQKQETVSVCLKAKPEVGLVFLFTVWEHHLLCSCCPPCSTKLYKNTFLGVSKENRHVLHCLLRYFSSAFPLASLWAWLSCLAASVWDLQISFTVLSLIFGSQSYHQGCQGTSVTKKKGACCSFRSWWSLRI